MPTDDSHDPSGVFYDLVHPPDPNPPAPAPDPSTSLMAMATQRLVPGDNRHLLLS